MVFPRYCDEWFDIGGLAGCDAALAAIRDIEITKIPFIISSSCTSGMTAYEDKHLGSKRRFYGVVGFDRTSC
jgi:hypothetical protein